MQFGPFDHPPIASRRQGICMNPEASRIFEPVSITHRSLEPKMGFFLKDARSQPAPIRSPIIRRELPLTGPLRSPT